MFKMRNKVWKSYIPVLLMTVFISFWLLRTDNFITNLIHSSHKKHLNNFEILLIHLS